MSAMRRIFSISTESQEEANQESVPEGPGSEHRPSYRGRQRGRPSDQTGGLYTRRCRRIGDET